MNSTTTEVHFCPPLRRLYLAAVAFLMLAAVAMVVADVPVGKWLKDEKSIQGGIRKAVMLSEMFGHGVGVGFIVLTLVVLDRSRRCYVPRLLACSFGAGILANVVKMFVARTRPAFVDFSEVTTASQTFIGWLPVFRPVHAELHGFPIQSFPSGHTATAVGLAIVLGRLYPHGGWLFVCYAMLAGLQRVIAHAHFPSDVLTSGGLACLTAAVCFDQRFLGRLFLRWEQRGKQGS